MTPDSGEPTAGALDGLKIVELAEGVAGPYCGKLLADLGAEVIKVERPRCGDPCRDVGPFYGDEPSPDAGLLFNFLNTSKLGVSLDLHTSLGGELLDRLLADADVFLFGGDLSEAQRPPIEPKALQERHPRLVCTYVTPFGLTGPHATWQAGELVAFQMSGLGQLTPDGVGPPTDKPPLKAGGHQALMIAGLTAAGATMQALFAREASGQGQLVDVSHVEPIASYQFMNVARWLYMGEPGRRRYREGGRRLQARDGVVSISMMQEHQWTALVEAMDSPEWAKAPEFATRADRTRNMASLSEGIQSWVAELSKEEVTRRAQARRIPAFPENNIGEAVDSAQVRSRDFVGAIPLANGAQARAPLAPYSFSETPVRIRRPAPRLGEHNEEIFGGRLGLSKEALALAYEASIA